MSVTVSGQAATRERTIPWSGQSVARKEDGRLVQGQGSFIDDLGMHGQGYAWFVRSPHAHARIVSIDTSAALALEGVYAVLTGAEARSMCEVPFFQIAPGDGGRIEEWPLAVDTVRYQGDAVAVVLADSRDTARDAAELVEVEFAPLPVVVDGVEAADPSAPVLHDKAGTNVAWHGVYDFGDIDWALKNADHVVKIGRMHFHRFSSTPLECNGAVVDWDRGSGVVEVKSNLQMPMFAAMVMGPTLGVPINKFSFSSRDIGGAFGNKISFYPQIAALALLSKKAGRPAKWTEYRTEHMMTSTHGNERTFLDIEVPVMADGTILGVKARAYDDVGAYLHYEPLGAVIWSQVVSGCYKFRNVRVDFTTTVTNKCPVSPNRGYSRMQHLWMLERIIDIVARELDFDPVELRKANYVQPEDYPYETPNGCVYDSGDLPGSLDAALRLADVDTWRQRKVELGTGSGKRIGIGIGSTLDSGTNNFGQARIINPDLPFSGNGEAAFAKLDLYGEVNINLGTTPQGQSHETTAAQVAADILNLPPDRVTVTTGFDQAHNAFVGFSGTYASQFAVTGLGAVMGAVEKLRDEILEVASFALQTPRDELELADGVCAVKGDAARAIPFIGIANLIYTNNAVLPIELASRVTLNCRHVYVPPFAVPDTEHKTGNLTLTYSSQIHVCVVEVDEETGVVEILAYSAVDDCGKRINPQIVEGQVHGAAGLGIGAALYESFEYDEDGQLQEPSFYEYHAGTAMDIPDIRCGNIESASPFSPNGAKGMGEGGGAPLHAVCSAIQDALGKDDAIVSDSHNSWERVYRLLRSGEHKEPRGVSVTSRDAEGAWV
ncbi:MAG: xanthine dehydrogenase family protein molybdopterin-binding subunit [Candidatus Dormibacteria bacterium]